MSKVGASKSRRVTSLQRLKPGDGLRRIAFVGNSGFSLYRFRRRVLLYFRDLGFEVICVAPLDRFAERLVREGFEFVRIKLSPHGTSPVVEAANVLKLKRLYAKLQIDLVFHFTIKPNIYGTIAAHYLGIPTVAVVTGLGSFAAVRPSIKSKAIHLLYGTSVKQASEVWFLNAHDRGYFEGKGWSQRNASRLLPGEGIDGNEFRYLKLPERRKNFDILFIGRLLYSKGLADLVKAMRLLRRQNVAVTCRVVGFANDEDPDSISLELVSEWHREGLIIYEGGQDRISKFLKQSHVVVLPSYYNEGLSRVLLEAMASGRPIISTRTQGCGELVNHGVNGLAVPVQDPVALASAISHLSQLPHAALVRLGEAGREKALKEYGISKVLEVYSAFVYGRLRMLGVEG